jgi:glycosyltransferase involved in cell wall biosynthesis
VREPVVMGIVGPWTACEEYRFRIPFQALQEHGWEVFIAHLNRPDPRELTAHVIVMGRVLARDYRLVEHFVREYQRQGRRFIFETDDDLSNQWRRVHEHSWEPMLRLVDAVTVTNHHLRRLILPYNPHVFVIPNHVDLRDFMGAERKNHHLTIGLEGSPTHYEDWKPVAQPLFRIRKEYPDVRILLYGYCPDYLEGVADEVMPWLPFREHAQRLVEVDIGLCPLDSRDGFNLSKSPIKAIIYWAAGRPLGKGYGGAAVIASDHPVYRRVVNKGNGLLVQDNEWYGAIRTLIEDEEMRRRLGIAGHRWVQKNANIQTGWKLWANCYRQVMKKAR